jgi:hypothetical protein
MSTIRSALPFCLAALLSLTATAQAQTSQTSPSWDPFFLGYETEPGMDFGGRTVASVQSLISHSLGSLPHVENHPAVAPAWEFPVGAFLTVVQHEVDGHGGRAREFGLHPSYGFGFDFSGYTSTERPPRTHEENVLIDVAGTEADAVMARRILLDALRPEGVDGAKIPLAMMAKLDLTLYVSDVENPKNPGKLIDQYRSGNDMASYLISRQAARNGGRPGDVWTGDYEIDRNDPLLRRNWDDMRTTALWNALDPSLVAAVYAYFRDHVLHGETRVHPPALRVSDGLSLTVGTRGALGPQSVSRFLDLYGLTRHGVLNLYLRDLDSSTDRTRGAGAAVQGLRLGPALEIGVQADTWKEPQARERIYDEDTSWNVTGTVDAALAFGDHRWGLAAKVGTKSKGFLPGRPTDDGVYAGFGVTAAW